MNKLFMLVTLFLLAACQKEKPKNTSIPNIDSAASPGIVEIPKSNPLGIIYKSELVRMYGDTTKEKKGNYTIEVKFQPYISFKDFQVENVYKEKGVPLKFQSNKTVREYKTAINEVYKRGTTTFAGHYCTAEWDCGALCHSGVLIDLKTGIVYDMPPSATGYGYMKDSRMIIVNPPDEEGYYLESCVACIPKIWVWDEEKKKFTQIKPD